MTQLALVMQVIALAALDIAPVPGLTNPFDDGRAEFTQGAAHSYNIGVSHDSMPGGSSGWCPGLRSKKGRCKNASPPRALSTAQIEEVVAALRDSTSLDHHEGRKRCVWNPHHAFELVDHAGLRRTIDVCFECDQITAPGFLSTKKEHDLSPRGRARLRAVFEAVGLLEPRRGK